MSDTVKIEAEFDLTELQKTVNDALDLKDNATLFGQLAAIAKAKAEVADLKDAIDKIEADAKGLINAKAKALYGDNWQAIAGPGYKISRSFTGSKYDIVDPEKVAPELLVVKYSVDSKAVENVVKATSELPQGIEVNQARGESIRLTVKELPNA